LTRVTKGSHVPAPPSLRVKSEAEAAAEVPSLASDSLVMAPIDSVPTPKGRVSDGWAASISA